MEEDRETPQNLSGWKEIAAHLQVTVRTAQLWEKGRGLPVRRIPGEGKPRVWASVEELDAWVREDGAGADRQPPAGDATSPPRRGGIPGGGRGAFAAAAVIVVAAGFLGSVVWRPPVEPVRCTVDGEIVAAFDGRDRRIWQRHVEGLALRPRSDGSGACAVHDADLDGTTEVYLKFVPEQRLTDPGRVMRLEPNGEVRWETPIGRELLADDRPFGNAFRPTHFLPIEVEGRGLLLVLAKHNPLFPAVVALLDARTGEAVDTYYHPGAFYDAALGDVDGDGDTEALLGGINNPGPGPGRPVVVVLDLPFSGSDGSRRVERDFFGNPGPRELAYYALPRSDLDDLDSVESRVVEIGAPEGGHVVAIVRSTAGDVTYAIDLATPDDARIASAIPSPELREAHDRLTEQRRLDHRMGPSLPGHHFILESFETAPDANALGEANLTAQP